MLFRHFISLRKLSTTTSLGRPRLSSDYKSKELWDSRFNCKYLTDSQAIKAINSKIAAKDQLDELEVDIFINVSAPRTDEIAQLRESADILKRFRRSPRAHLLIPSTQHGVCRLFLDSERLTSLVSMIEQRVDYGIFPDPIILNLCFDAALEQDNLSLASRLAAHIMLQEDFGENFISDVFSLYSVAKYIESKPDFQQWSTPSISADPIFMPESSGDGKTMLETSLGDGDEEEEDQYIRIPFLRNPYNDQHFDLTNPRVICGKTLSMLASQFSSDMELVHQLRLLGSVLQGEWNDSMTISEECVQSNIKAGCTKELAKFYIENLHGLPEPSVGDREALLVNIEKLNSAGEPISAYADEKTNEFSSIEAKDLDCLRSDIIKWSERRDAIRKTADEWAERQRIIEEIRKKKEEIKRKEQYLYFYDNLRKKTLGRLSYD